MLSDRCAPLYQPTIDALPAHLCVLDATGCITCVNDAWRTFARANGWTDPAAGVGMRYPDVCDLAASGGSGPARMFANGLRAVLAGSSDQFTQEYDCHSPTEQRWFLGRVTRLRQEGAPHFLVTHEPITARVQAERSAREVVKILERKILARTVDLEAANADLRAEVEARRAAEARLKRFELLSEHTRDIILFVRHPDGGILDANHAAQLAYGRSLEELTTLTIRDLRADDTQPALADQMQTADSAGLLFETRHRRRDGTPFPVEVSSRGVTDAGVRVLLSVIRDVSERKRAEAEREHLIGELTAALERVKTLRGVVPICAWCKKIRDDQGYWEQVEVFVQHHTDAEFSHGLCPECERKFYRDYPGSV